MAAKKNGLIQEKNSNGQVIKETEWLDGKKTGWENTYDNQGKYVKRVQYEDGHKILEEEYYKGLITKLIPYANGKKEGLVIEYADGIKIEEINYVNGKKEGNIREFYKENGVLKAEKIYENGKRNSAFEKSYYPSGNKKLIKDESQEIHYLVDNNIPSYIVFLADGEIGHEEKFYRNGNKASIEYWSHPQKDQFFDLEGHTITQKEFYGKFQSELNYPIDWFSNLGEEIEDEEIKDESNSFDENFDLSDEDSKLCNDYQTAIDSLIDVAKSIDLLGLVAEGCVKTKLHDSVEKYTEMKNKYEAMMKKLEAK